MSQNFALTRKEKYRFEIISLCLKKELTNKEAAIDLHRSIRQIQRIKVAVQTRGVQGAIHGLKGNPSNHRKKCQARG